MFAVKDLDTSLELDFSSQLDLVDRASAACVEFAAAHDSGCETGRLAQVLRELLLNAVEHGNRGDPSKRVTCTLKRIGNGRYALAVGDEGPGIDPCRLAPARPDDASSERSRGMGIVHTYSDAVELTPDSTRITATVTLTRPTTFATVDQDDATVMTPSGDITAVVAEEFRRALLLWVEKSQTHLTLDLRNVNNIDSVSLSVLVVLGRMVKSKELTRRVRVVNAGRDVTNLFLLTRMNRLFEVVQLTREQTGGVTAYGSLYP